MDLTAVFRLFPDEVVSFAFWRDMATGSYKKTGILSGKTTKR
jgi:hypothetical protein